MNQVAKSHLITAAFMVVGISPLGVFMTSLTANEVAWFAAWEAATAGIGFVVGFLARPNPFARGSLTVSAPFMVMPGVMIVAIVFDALVPHLPVQSAVRGFCFILLSPWILALSASAMGFVRFGHDYRHRKP